MRSDRKNTKRGSITLYVSLSLLVLLSLLAAGLYSARQAAGRVICASATEQALFSLFGQYDRAMLERFGLLFLDGSYGSDTLHPGRLLQEVEEEAAYILRPGKGNLFAQGDLLGIRADKGEDSITGYVLATDDGGRAFRRQVCEIMQKELGPAGLLLLEKTLQEQDATAQAEETAFEGYVIDPAGSLPAVPESEEEEEEPPVIPSWFFDPWQTLRSYEAAGVLAMVLPEASAVSACETDTNGLVSHRALQSGMQMPADGWEGNGERLLMLEYLVERFACYTTTGKAGEGALQYQIEYALGGFSSDRENLQETLLQLLHLRTALNFLHILRTGVLRSEAKSAATLLATLVGHPELEPVITLALEYAWAYGEGVRDLQALLAGNKIPLLKSETTWNLSLTELPFLRFLPPPSGQNGRGLTYRDYLRLLLFRKNTAQLTDAAMDLVELDMRAQDPTFRLDTCIDALRVELHTHIGRNTYTIERSYGYNA